MMDFLTKASAPMRVGAMLVVIGVLGAALTASHATSWWLFTYGLDALALLAGALLLRGNLATARLVRAVMALGLGAMGVALIGLAVVRPVNLTLTEIRLDPTSFLWPAIVVAVSVCALAWIVWELGREPVQTAIYNAGLRRWDSATPAKAGAAVMFVLVALAWAMLHGNSASVAVSLAQQQLGFGYRYALTWISSASLGGRKAIDGVVTAWNDHEVKKVLLHWEQR
ncbi:MAG: hypothetical protein ABSA58_14195 [Acetobacteraceae bacterium]